MFLLPWKRAAAKKAAEEAAARKAALREELNSYKLFLEAEFSRLDEVGVGNFNFVLFRTSAYNQLHCIYMQYPEIEKLLQTQCSLDPNEQVYTCFDDEGSPYNLPYSEMDGYRRQFILDKKWEEYQKKWAQTHDRPLTLEDVGPLGGHAALPDLVCPYLSFAYVSKMAYRDLLTKITDWLNENPA